MRDWLKKKRMELEMTQQQVAEKVDIARTSYAMYEQGERNPSVETAKKIGDLLNFNWIIFFED